MKNFLKLVTVFLTTIILAAIIAPNVAYASTQNNMQKEVQTIQSNDKIQEQQLTETIQYIFNHAVTYDEQGYVEDIDFNSIRSRYGDSQALTIIENDVNADLMDRASAWKCTVVAIQDTLGVAAVSSLISGGIVGLVQRKAAASLIWSFGRCMWF